MTFCTITPTRKDRPEFLEFCKHQLSRMTKKPDHSYFIDHKPEPDSSVDLIARVRKGIEMAKADGFEFAFIIEDDDFYSRDYFQNVSIAADFVGCKDTIYYNIRTKEWQSIYHANRSSLFTTGIRLSSMDKFRWPKPHEYKLDIAIWQHAEHYRRSLSNITDIPKAIGIKHGTGVCAGMGHFRKLQQSDPDMSWLKSVVDSDAYIFYKTIKL